MASRGRGRGRATRSVRADHDPEQPQLSPDPAPRPAPKRRTIADNAKAIESMETKLNDMSNILLRISDNMLPPQHPADPLLGAGGDARPAPAATAVTPPQPAGPAYNHGRHYTGYVDRAPAPPGPARPRHTSAAAGHPYGRPDRPADGRSPLDPLNARLPPQSRYYSQNLHDLEDSEELQERMAHLLTPILAPLHTTGKNTYAHSHVVRGVKKTKTNLGELTLAEYNYGFIRLMNTRDTPTSDRSHMFKHLEAVNQDAASYEWVDVRHWSEEVCSLISVGDLTWDNSYQIDLLRLKFSQMRRGAGAQGERTNAEPGALDALVDIPADVRAARPAPPCRHYNSGTCTHATHHVQNGYRYLHICSFCILHKCSYFPHSEKDCRSKDYKKKNPKEKDPGLGFGK